MRTLLLANKEYSEYFIYCPFCKVVTEDIEVDDYVKSNCLFWCKNCQEIMICPTGYNDPNNEMDKLDQGCPVNSCSRLLSQAEAIQYMSDMKFILEKDLTEYYAYTIGILRINFLSKDAFSSMPNADVNNTNLDVLRFKDLPSNVDHSHAGTYLYYRATCSECGRYYESFIWGD